MATYDMDIEHGIIIHWYSNGNLKQIRYFSQGEGFGGWTLFDEEGHIKDEGDAEHKFFKPFFGKNTAPKGFEETSPSITSDGKTIVFARHKDWIHKVPYIAHLKEGKWKKERLHFIDTLYNLAISPDGNRIVFGTFDEVGDKEIRNAFFVDRKGEKWGEPKEISSLAGISAGYFQIRKDGSLLFFARVPKNGIYQVFPKGKIDYGEPLWFSDEVGLPNSDSFDAFLNDEGNKLIVTQAYSSKKYPKRGEIGMYLYIKEGAKWKRKNRIPLGYGWGAQITSDHKFVFVRNEDIQYVPLKELNISW